MTHPHLPITHAELSRLVAELWPEVARMVRVDPGRLVAHAQPGGCLLILVAPGVEAVSQHETEAWPRALSRLLEDLEARYLVVDRAEGRVLGWAAGAVSTSRDHRAMIRFTDLPEDHPQRRRWDDRIDAERQERARAEDWPTPGKREAARAQRRAAR